MKTESLYLGGIIAAVIGIGYFKYRGQSSDSPRPAVNADTTSRTIFRTWNSAPDASKSAMSSVDTPASPPQNSIVMIKSLDDPDDCVIIENYDARRNRDGDPSSVQNRHIKVRVPAVTSSFGAGLGCIGMALDLWLEVDVTIADQFSFEFDGIDCDGVPLDGSSLVCVNVERMFERVGKTVPPLCYRCRSTIPCNKGLGLSAASIVGGVIAGAVLSGVHPLPNYQQLLQIATDGGVKK